MKEYVVLYYKDLEIAVATKYHPPVIGGAWGGEPGWTEMEPIKVDYTYEVEKDLIIEVLIGLGEENISRQEIDNDFEAIFDKNENKLLELFKDRAIEEAEDNYDYPDQDLEPLEIKEKELV